MESWDSAMLGDIIKAFILKSVLLFEVIFLQKLLQLGCE